ncbi:hypothetical protein L7F22_039648 [Adiantum nelumboides]|nr:hypothetical protein [Adiantum nelumboides]
MGVSKAFIKNPETLFALETMRDKYWHNMAMRIQRAFRNYMRYKHECARRIQRMWKNNKEKLVYVQLRDYSHQVLAGRKERRRFSLISMRKFLGDYLDLSSGNSAEGFRRTRSNPSLLLQDRIDHSSTSKNQWSSKCHYCKFIRVFQEEGQESYDHLKKDETVQKMTFTRVPLSLFVLVNHPTVQSRPPAKKIPGIVRPITSGKLLRAGGPSNANNKPKRDRYQESTQLQRFKLFQVETLLLDFFYSNSNNHFDYYCFQRCSSSTKESFSRSSSSTTSNLFHSEYKALFDFETEENGEMALVKDELVEVSQKDDNGWWLVKKNGNEGWAPSNYLELVPQAPPKPKAAPAPPAATKRAPPPAPTSSSITPTSSSINSNPRPQNPSAAQELVMPGMGQEGGFAAVLAKRKAQIAAEKGEAPPASNGNGASTPPAIKPKPAAPPKPSANGSTDLFRLLSNGYYVGFIESIFALVQMFTVFFWGRLSDSIGRKPVLLIGMSGVAVSTLAFGLSKTFLSMILARSISGLMNGNVAVLKSVLGEITDNSNQARCFVLLPVSFAIGSIIGPSIGGSLSTQSRLFQAFSGVPSSLPSFHTSCVSNRIYFSRLEESQGHTKSQLMKTLSLSSSFIQPVSLLQSSTQTNREEQAAADEEEENRLSIQASQERPTIRSLLTPQIISVLTTQMMNNLMNISYSAIMPLFCYSTVENGGLGWSKKDIGYVLGINGIAGLIVQLIIFPRLEKRLGGPLYVYRRVLMALPLTFLMFPLAHWTQIHYGRSLTWIVMITMVVFKATGNMGLVCATLLVNNSAPSKASLGSLNGLSQTCGSFSRFIGPFTATSVFAYSISLKNFLGGGLIWVFLVGLLSSPGVWLSKSKSTSRLEEMKIDRCISSPTLLVHNEYMNE